MVGLYSTGIVSHADVMANRLGYEFYQGLASNPWTYRFTTARYTVEQLGQMNEGSNPCTYMPGVKVGSGE